MFRHLKGFMLSAFVLGVLGTIATPTTATEPPTLVTYRLTTTRSMHLQDEQMAQQYTATLKQLGCEVQASGHDGHIDLAYHCRDWRQATFTDHGSAHKWQDWLTALGFETQHQH